MAAPMRVCCAAYSRRIFQLSRFYGRGTYFSVTTRQEETIKLVSARCFHQSPCSKCSTPANNATQHLGKQPNVFQHFKWLSEKSPAFPVCGDKITILEGPTDFYNTLKARIKNSKHRIVLTSLYLGTGPKEEELVASLHDACRRSHLNGNTSAPLKLRILLDCTRGTRGKHNSCTMLRPLLQTFPAEVQVALYHTPDLRGILKRLIPERYNEVIGLSHLKIFIFDDTVIISGANLSESYFTNRQDRYVMLEDCPHLADFFNELVATVSSFSFQLNPDDTLTLDPEFNIHPFEGEKNKFKDIAREKVQRVLEPLRWTHPTRKPASLSHTEDLKYSHRKTIWRKHRNLSDDIIGRESLRGMHKDVTVDNSETSDEIRSSELWAALDSKSEMKVEGASEERLMMDYPETQNPSKDFSVKSVREEAKPGCCGDTVIFPLVQMGSFGVRLDQEVTGQLLRTAEPGSHCVLASGYFNLTKEYMELVVGSKAKYDILMASPKANGFYGAKGISGFVPDAYTFIAKNFWRKVCRRNQEDRITMYEYHRQDWTFHVKGLWYYLNGMSLPSLTMIGSPNFGHRSVHRDLEAQLAIVTTNVKLQKQLHQEQQRLFKKSQPVSSSTFKEKDRIVPVWARIFTFVTRNFF
ncbi:CDP-diacylglycerol--glycerol-3-phosphate 3-phosphatidyltransferase, mitochondrial-like [Asterias rubens]|uniref:CDP-diacylglycerol--glycerol-3-phosphate 3-phosphatidyltransferase, mitochondrial-like n=1 Tax=Asterias rubens TaxID=7604 RepID=UPI0014554A6D|nr:CDP-diacylglycerol--glycerol-3-phosphate 3-phosphatidyltransferase, mitochondrial-like [Asterias rubens]